MRRVILTFYYVFFQRFCKRHSVDVAQFRALLMLVLVTILLLFVFSIAAELLIDVQFIQFQESRHKRALVLLFQCVAIGFLLHHLLFSLLGASKTDPDERQVGFKISRRDRGVVYCTFVLLFILLLILALIRKTHFG